MADGYTAQDTNPTSQEGNQWDWQPAAGAAVNQNPQNVGGGFGQATSEDQVQTSMGVGGESLAQMGQNAETTANGTPGFGESYTQAIGGSTVP